MAADVLAGIKLISKADTSGIVAMSSAVTQLSSELNMAKANMAAFISAGKTLMGVGFAIEASLGVAAAAAVNYEYLIQRIATRSQLAAEQTAYLHDRFLELSTTIPMSAEGLAQLGEQAGRLTHDAMGIERITKAGAELELLSNGAITGAQAITQMGRIARVYGLDITTDVNKITSAFVGLARGSTATEAEIAAVVSRTGELGKQAGFTVDQMAALAATAKDLGLDGRRAAGAIETLLTSMMKNDTARFFARQIRMTGHDFREALGKEPLKILEKLQGAFDHTDPRMLEFQLTRLGFTEKAAQTLVLGLADSHSTLAKNIKTSREEFEKGTAATEAYEQLIATTKMQLTILWNTIKAVAISFGEILLPPLRLILRMFTFLLQIVLAIPKPIKVLMVLAAALTGGLLILAGATMVAVASAIALKIAINKAAIAVMFMDMEALATSGGGLTVLITKFYEAAAASAFSAASFFEGALGAGSLAETISLLTAQLFAGEIGWAAFASGAYAAAAAVVSLEMLTGIGEVLLIIAAAVAVVVAAYYALKPAILDVIDAFTELWTPVQTLIDGMKAIVAQFGFTSGGFGSTLLTLIRIGLLPIIIQLKSVAVVIRIVAAVLTGFARAIIFLTKPIIEPFARLWNFIKSIVSPIIDAFDNMMTSGTKLGVVFDYIADAAGIAFALFTPIGQTLTVLAGIFQAVEFIIVNAWQGVTDAFADLWDEIDQGVGGLKVMWDELVATFMEAIDPIRVFMSEWVGGGEGVTNIIKGIGSAIAWVVKIALWPFVQMLKGVVFFIEILGAMAITVGKVMIVAFKPVLWFFEKIANMISYIIAAWRWWTGAQEKEVAAPAPGPKQPNMLGEGGTTEAGIAMRHVAATIPELREPIEKHLAPSPKLTLAPLSEADMARHRMKAVTRELYKPEPIPAVRPPMLGLSRAMSEGAAATRAAAQQVSSSGHTPITITIPVSVMMDGEEIGRAVASVNDDQIRRQFGKRALRFSGVE